MRRVPTGVLILSLAVAAYAVAASGPAPATPGYVAPWNRPTTDSVVDLDPGTRGGRFEMSGRLLAPDGVSPMAGLRVYAHHADMRYGYSDPNYPELDPRAGVLLSGPDGVYRTKRKQHVGDWFPTGNLDSTRAAIARRYERAPWPTGSAAKAPVPH